MLWVSEFCCFSLIGLACLYFSFRFLSFHLGLFAFTVRCICFSRLVCLCSVLGLRTCSVFGLCLVVVCLTCLGYFSWFVYLLFAWFVFRAV